MPSVHEVTIEPLTEEAFAPFGQIIAAKDRPPDFRTESGTQPAQHLSISVEVGLADHGPVQPKQQAIGTGTFQVVDEPAR